MTLTEWLDQAEARATAATPGPWEPVIDTTRNYLAPGDECWLCTDGRPLVQSFKDGADTVHEHQEPSHRITAPGDATVAGNYDYEEGGIVESVDTVFVAAARTDLPVLSAMVRAVLALHARRPHDLIHDPISFGQTEFPDRCTSCRSTYPCPTMAALDAAREATS